MLLGQNVNSYGKTLKEPISFARLLQRVEQIDGLERIRFMTSHPDLSDELIQVMASSKKICTHLHLPLQSGEQPDFKADEPALYERAVSGVGGPVKGSRAGIFP